MIYLQLIWVYLKIGLLGFGGGYAMLPLIQEEVVEHYHWLTMQEFTDIVAISQVTPGPIGINSATYIGYTVTGGNVLGSVAATLAVMFPSFVLCFLISHAYRRFIDNKHVQGLFVGIRPVTAGLIASAALLLMTPDNFIDVWSIVLFLVCLVCMLKRWVHPILLMILSGLAGYLIYI